MMEEVAERAKTGHRREGSRANFIKPPFGYFGAKHRLARRIVEMLPPHAAWVEACCGSAVVTLNKPGGGIEIINDLDHEIVNAFAVLRTRYKALLHQLQYTPYSRLEYERAKAAKSNGSSLERARRFFVLSMMTINGTSGSPSNSGFSFSDSYERGNMEARVSRWHNLPERLEAVVERLRCVRVEHKDVRALVKQFSRRPGTCVYIDPPYFTDRKHTYLRDANTEAFHSQLLEKCVDSDAMIMISSYDSALYRSFLKRDSGWSTIKIDAKTRGVGGEDVARNEVLWMNQAFRSAKRSGKAPLNLTAAERREKKVNPQRAGRAAV